MERKRERQKESKSEIKKKKRKSWNEIERRNRDKKQLLTHFVTNNKTNNSATYEGTTSQVYWRTA